MSTWPRDELAELEEFYGKHELQASGMPTAKWESRYLTWIIPPYPLYASWQPQSQITRLRCHVKVAESLRGVLVAIQSHYGSQGAIEAARMHLSGGCYQFRRRSGGARLSLHAWGAAIDLDPDHNPYNEPYDSTGMMPAAVIELFVSEGWRWGGTFSKPDCMHFQAAT